MSLIGAGGRRRRSRLRLTTLPTAAPARTPERRAAPARTHISLPVLTAAQNRRKARKEARPGSSNSSRMPPPTSAAVRHLGENRWCGRPRTQRPRRLRTRTGQESKRRHRASPTRGLSEGQCHGLRSLPSAVVNPGRLPPPSGGRGSHFRHHRFRALRRTHELTNTTVNPYTGAAHGHGARQAAAYASRHG